MPACLHCGEKWTWKDTFKRIASFKNEMVCPYCKKSQYQAKSSRQKTSMLIVAPSLVLPVFVLFDLYLPLLLLCYAAAFLLTPFFVKLAKENAPLW
ncbi:TIGR04104 family putative zinc finger protein [Jeotgalibacillus campisalis]|uniref:Cxxc_20_cxxc protein n=1 Tax=Jeotgalibacillus campisalis TaxID=220754 RepID=A0A0C2W526_9BACL|nr:TIGR04104 family putative zinc finger protein [Jeotgalibacillus campisalis]KIL51118.1 hypothetical protein KR50_09990 [Jeotgalibacillus campisalis]